MVYSNYLQMVVVLLQSSGFFYLLYSARALRFLVVTEVSIELVDDTSHVTNLDVVVSWIAK